MIARLHFLWCLKLTAKWFLLHYSEQDWKKHSFAFVQKNFWKDKSNRRAFMEDLGRKQFVRGVDDWRWAATFRSISEHGGEGLLAIYGGNIQRALQDIFPEHNWQFNSVTKVHGPQKTEEKLHRAISATFPEEEVFGKFVHESQKKTSEK
eukprot:TRINITY_DN639_c0_g1_i5.p1 TRINITY_DN639_c0_g1~~TRINITY_DN639_c0_g1_i5.p1  ORF type:complete len:150 (-),score=24.44 TRINITY_DN639_c0_g1_i5:10-459(-)